MSGYINTLKKYVVFSGRASRKEFWVFVLVTFAIQWLLTLLGGILGSGDSSGTLATILGLVSTIFSLGTILPTIAVYVRRMHDVGRPGWWIIIPIANLIFTLQAGTAGDNAYGPAPTA